MNLDINFIRSNFPAFKEPSLAGWAFFESAGGSYMCQQVIDRLTAYYSKTKVQPYYSYPASAQAGRQMDESYQRLADYLNVGQDELNFGPSTSQNVYVLAQSLSANWQEGDEIILSMQNHEANSGAWRRLAERGIVIKDWHIDSQTGQLSITELEKLLSPKTKMVAFPHTSNVVAHINPVKDIAAAIHKAGAIAVVDGVSYAPHGLPDIKALDADIYLFSLYKTWGPHLGAMYVNPAVRKEMANQSHYYYKDEAHYSLTPAGPDHAQIAAAAGIAEYLDAVYAHHFDEDVLPAEKGRRLHQIFSDYEKSLLTPLLDFFKSRNDVFIVGPDDPAIRASTVTIKPMRKRVEEIVATLEAEKLMVASGGFDGVRQLGEMNIEDDPGVIRMSFLHYTSREEIDQLIEGLKVAL
jgi:selenocysteine lyase/cysteine desulfurase